MKRWRLVRELLPSRKRCTLPSGAVSARNQYLLASTIVWVAIWVATGAVEGDDFNDMIAILGGGTVFFLVIVPAWLFRKRD